MYLSRPIYSNIANDTKYRSLKLIRNKILYAKDSNYLPNPDTREQVREHERKLGLLRQAGEKQKEAEELIKRAMQ